MAEATRARRRKLETVVARAGDVTAVGALISWVVVAGRVLHHSIFVSHDTMISYAHVWFVSDRLWHAHLFPIHMPMLGHGRAYAFPYGLVPWLTAAIVRPLAGDWIVTVWLVLG